MTGSLPVIPSAVTRPPAVTRGNGGHRQHLEAITVGCDRYRLDSRGVTAIASPHRGAP